MNQVALQQSITPTPANEPPPHPGYDEPEASAPAPASGYAAPSLFAVGERSQTTQIEQARVIAEVQGAIMVAQRVPRNINAAIEEMRKVCTIEMMADRAFFAYDKGGKTISKGSIHLAREEARIWGNITYGIKELSRRDARPGELYGESEMLAYAWDLQTNARPETTFIVPHYMDLKGGKKKALTEGRAIYEHLANMGSRRLREMIFSVIPRWLTDEAEDLCRRTLENGDGKTPFKERLATAITVSKTWNVTPAMIEKKFGCAITQLNSSHLAELRIIFRSFKNNELSLDEAFPETPAADVGAALREKAGAAANQTSGSFAVDKTAATQAGTGGAPPAPTITAPAAAPTKAPANTVDHAATLKVIQSRMVKAGSLATVDATVVDFAEELDLMRTEAAEMYAEAMAAINGKREALKA